MRCAAMMRPPSPSGCCLRVPHQHVPWRCVVSAGARPACPHHEEHRRHPPYWSMASIASPILNIEKVFGPIPSAEHILVANGEIVSSRGYCDPCPMLGG